MKGALTRGRLLWAGWAAHAGCGVLAPKPAGGALRVFHAIWGTCPGVLRARRGVGPTCQGCRPTPRGHMPAACFLERLPSGFPALNPTCCVHACLRDGPGARVWWACLPGRPPALPACPTCPPCLPASPPAAGQPATLGLRAVARWGGCRPATCPCPDMAADPAAGEAAAVPEEPSLCAPLGHREHHCLHYTAVQVRGSCCPGVDANAASILRAAHVHMRAEKHTQPRRGCHLPAWPASQACAA